MKIRTVLSALSAAAVAVSISIVSAPQAGAVVPTAAAGSFEAIAPSRVLDTRTGTGAPQAPIPAKGTLTFTPTTGIIGPVGAVVLNVTVTNTSVIGFLTVFAAGTTLPLASNLNYVVGQNIPNMVVSKVSAGGQVSIYNGSTSTVDVMADIEGYFVGGANTGVSGTFVPLDSKRVLDTRFGTGAPKKRVAAHSAVAVKIAGLNGVPADATSVAVNVTASNGLAAGSVTAYPGSPVPLASVLNYQPREDRAGLGLIALDSSGSMSLYNGSVSSVDLIADVTGYFVGGTPATDGAFIPSTPYRIYDGRVAGGPTAAQGTTKIQVFPPNDPTFNVFKAVVVNVSAAQPTGSGYLTTWSGATARPTVSNSNFLAGQNVTGVVVVPVNSDGTISIFNGSSGNVYLVVDVTGFFYNIPALV